MHFEFDYYYIPYIVIVGLGDKSGIHALSAYVIAILSASYLVLYRVRRSGSFTLVKRS